MHSINIKQTFFESRLLCVGITSIYNKTLKSKLWLDLCFWQRGSDIYTWQKYQEGRVRFFFFVLRFNDRVQVMAEPPHLLPRGQQGHKAPAA